MHFFTELINAIIMAEQEASERRLKNGLESGGGTFGWEGCDYDSEYHNEHGEFPHETRLKEFEQKAEERRNAFKKKYLL